MLCKASTSQLMSKQSFGLFSYRQMNVGQNSRDSVCLAYEFALRHIGHDKESAPLWTDYIQLLKSIEVRLCAANLSIIW